MMENWDTHSWSLTHYEFGKANLKSEELMVRIHLKKSCTCNQLYQISTQIKKNW